MHDDGTTGAVLTDDIIELAARRCYFNEHGVLPMWPYRRDELESYMRHVRFVLKAVDEATVALKKEHLG
jgi:hypothetical protein